jgi:SAM-dependent methyltransferase
VIAEFTDPRLVAIYDTVNSYSAGTQPDFYADLAAELGTKSIVDLGCGTGLITRELARQGYQMTGIDPAPAMIDRARRGAYGDQVHWICGDAGQLGPVGADLAIMTGHVAQFFLTDESWSSALAALHRALRPGGWLAFETRNPAAREWESWTHEVRSSAVDPAAGRVDTWLEFQHLDDGIVTYAIHYVFAASGEETVTANELRFRSLDELTGSLEGARFAIEQVYGDWDRRPATPITAELIVVAKLRG